MKLYRETLTPQLLQYDDFDDRGEVRYLPYLMYFHRASYRSPVINTDRLGFRLSRGPGGQTASAAGELPKGPVKLLMGSSTALGIGATNDGATISSRLWSTYAPSAPWLNFGGRSHNSAQELMLFLFHQHLLPEVEEIVILSGLNNLALSLLPEWQRGEDGAFFFSGEYFEAMDELRAKARKPAKAPARGLTGLLADRKPAAPAPRRPAERKRTLPELIDTAAGLTGRHLESLRKLVGPDVKITYALQPMAPWLREEHAPQEKLLFEELNSLSSNGSFEENYGIIASIEAGRTYAEALRVVTEKAGARFFDLNPAVADAIKPADWLFVDRAHYTDEGHEIVTRVMAETLGLS
ncbi:SGNH/GDSL hydrolase family protein [Streptomyces sp. HU2014]|uniref:SGNH/GDSL hydrolase family protein n=1 Tax=Streptomyces TaxID=1883 RepID=UPI000B44F53C|nr:MULTISPECIES: SGNH/GDSL hydrolase family protein [Streptomyces]UQI48779.1 SGNH/GDSL hydrolase family protein [Streptomyces sp. HU2014]